MPLHARDIQNLLARLEKPAESRLQLLDERGGLPGNPFAAFALVISSEQVLAKLQTAILNGLCRDILVDDGIIWEHFRCSPGRAFYLCQRILPRKKIP